MAELHRITTNYQRKQKDQFLGLEVKHIAILIGAFLFGVLLFTFFKVSGVLSQKAQVVASFAPAFGALAYIIYFFVKRPPNFHRDVWSGIFQGKHMSVKPIKQKNNPFIEFD